MRQRVSCLPSPRSLVSLAGQVPYDSGKRLSGQVCLGRRGVKHFSSLLQRVSLGERLSTHLPLPGGRGAPRGTAVRSCIIECLRLAPVARARSFREKPHPLRARSPSEFGVPPSGGLVRRPAFRRDWPCKRRPPKGGTPNQRRPPSCFLRRSRTRARWKTGSGAGSREKPHPYEHGVPPSLEYRLQAVWFVVPPSGGTGLAREDRLKAVLRTRGGRPHVSCDGVAPGRGGKLAPAPVLRLTTCAIGRDERC